MKNRKRFKWYVKGKRHQKEELKRVNQELLERMERLFSNSLLLLSIVIALWALTATLLAGYFENYNASKAATLIVGMLAVVLFGLPTLLLFPFSVKLHDNIRSVASLSAYIKVFFELPSLLDKEKKQDGNLYLWETLHCDATIPQAKFFSVEYVIIALLSPFLASICAGLFFFLTEAWTELLVWRWAFIISAVFYVILLGIMTGFVMKNARTRRHGQLYAAQYLEEYLKRAVIMGEIKKNDALNFMCFQKYLIERDNGVRSSFNNPCAFCSKRPQHFWGSALNYNESDFWNGEDECNRDLF